MWPAELAVVLALAACGDKAADDSGPAGDGETGSDGGGGDGETGSDGGGGDGGGGDGADEALFREAVLGAVEPAVALAEIAAGGGLPVQTATGSFLFGCLCGDGAWALAGDHDGWVGAAMERSGALSWIEVEVPSPDGSLYKFVEGGTTWTADPMARRYGYDDFGEHSLVRASAAHLERWLDVGGEGLAGRELRVWVPDGGAFTHALYAQDGQNLFDPQATWGGWRLQDSLPDGMLVVGVDNTADRMDEYTHVPDVIHGTTWGGRGDAYADLLTGTIRPLIEAEYGAAEVHGVMGSSLGGLVSAHVVHRYPQDWDMAISLSGTMGWGSIGADNETMPERWVAAGHGPVALYLDSGGGGTCWDGDGDGVPDDDPGASDNYCENAWMAESLAGVGYQWEVDLWHWHEPGASHDEAAWAARVWRPLEIFAAL
ncbi:hypothetical protein L6R53_02155 [Myxococcota bacterium]|nr:hypothetical protein [Myxococcota bacterium]